MEAKTPAQKAIWAIKKFIGLQDPHSSDNPKKNQGNPTHQQLKKKEKQKGRRKK